MHHKPPLSHDRERNKNISQPNLKISQSSSVGQSSPTPSDYIYTCTLHLCPQLYSKSVITHRPKTHAIEHPKKKTKKNYSFWFEYQLITGGLGYDRHGVAPRSTELAVLGLGGLRGCAAAAAGQAGAASPGPEAAADRGQHVDDGPADPPRPGGAGEAVRRPSPPPARQAPRVCRVYAGVCPGGTTGAGRCVLEPSRDHRHRLPHVRPSGHGVRALRALLAPDAQAVRDEALQPAAAGDMARRARRVRGARPRRVPAERRGREPRRAHLQPHQECHLPCRVRRRRDQRRRRRRRGEAGRVHRHPPGVLEAVRRLQHRGLHPMAELGGPAGHQRAAPQRARCPGRIHRQDHRRAHGEGKEPRRRRRRHGGRHARVPPGGEGEEGRRRRRGRSAEHAQPHPRQHQGHHHGRDVWRDGDGGVSDRVGDGGDDAQPRRPPPAAAGARRRRGSRPERGRVGPRQAPLPQVRHQGDAPAAPAHPAAPPRDRRGLRRRRLLRAPGLSRHDQRLRHRPRSQGLEGRRHVPALAVRAGGRGGRRARLQGGMLRVLALRVRPPLVPWHGARPLRAGARRGAARAWVQLGASRRDEAVRARHGRHLRPHRSARHKALRRAHAPPHHHPAGHR